MISIFRKIRQSMVKEKKVKNYILYAIGEILLVMIGILLALQVNNWNENRRANNQLKTIFKTIKEDLKTDTLVGTAVIRYYDSINKYSTKIINNEYTSKNIDSCITCRSLLTGYNPMNIQKKGYTLLQNYTALKSEDTDSLITDLSQFYTYFDAMISNNNDLVKSETLANLNYFKKQKWFIPWMQGQITDEMREFFGNSLDFKNRVAGNNILATSNHQGYLKLYKKNAIALLERINKRLNIKTEEQKEVVSDSTKTK